MREHDKKKRVLLVDDEDDILTVLSLALADYDYDVRTATSVDDAISLAQAWTPDLIVSDYAMPDRNGLDLLAWVNRHMPDIVATGRFAFLSGSFSALEAAAREFGLVLIQKPVRIESLLAFTTAATADGVDGTAAEHHHRSP